MFPIWPRRLQTSIAAACADQTHFVLLAATILRMKHVAMCLLAYVFVLTTFNVNSLLFFHRNAAANATFGSRPITASLVGTHRFMRLFARPQQPAWSSTAATCICAHSHCA